MPIPEHIKREMVKVPKGSAMFRNKVVKFDFVKTERDCPHNTRIHDYVAKGVLGEGPFNPAKAKRGLLYDYWVMIDGVKRGEFRRKYMGRGYQLMNLIGDPWRYLNTDPHKPKVKWSWTQRDTEGQRNFAADTLRALDEGHLLTPREAKRAEDKRARMELAERRKKYADACVNVIKSSGTDFHAALLDIQLTVNRMSKKQLGHPTVQLLRDKVEDALAKVKFPDPSEYGL